MSKVKPTPARRYDSPAIQERRQRIVEAVRRLIAEKGYDQFKLSEVAALAEVSERTVYNVAANRHALVALAVKSYQEELTGGLFSVGNYTFDDVLTSLHNISTKLLPEKSWAETLARLYFSRSTDSETQNALVSISESHLMPAIEYYRDQGALSEGANPELIAYHFTDTAFAILNDWALGRIQDIQFSPHLRFALLASLILVTTEPTRNELTRRFEQLGNTLKRE